MSVERSPDVEPSVAELSAGVPHRPSLWRQGDFMKLWTGQTISQFGDEITGLALPLLAINILGAGPVEHPRRAQHDRVGGRRLAHLGSGRRGT